MRKHYTERQKSDFVALATSGRATISEAAAQLEVRPSTAYYWMRARASTSKLSIATPTFARVVPSGDSDAGIILRISSVEIQVRHGFDPELLKDVVEALRRGVA